MFAPLLTMTFKSSITNALPGLAIAALVAAVVTPAPASASPCLFSKMATPEAMTSTDGPSRVWTTTPDGAAVGKALGGFGAIAALLGGGTLFYRKRRLARLANASASARLAETERPLTILAQPVLVDGNQPGQGVTEVAQTETAAGLTR